MHAVEHFSFRNGAVTLHAVAAGPADGPVVCLLHGFPEFWFGWRHQITALAAAGFRVVAPDGRGYNSSDKPSDVASYTLPNLVADVLALWGQIGAGRPMCLAGHDWGAAVAWAFAAQHPEKVKRLAILNVPHPAVMLPFLLTHPQQLLRSWYMFFFQIRALPEALFKARNFQVGVHSLTQSSRPGTFSPSDLDQYRAAWRQPGALSGMINWYRALLRNPKSFRVGDIDVPTLILWGKRDAFLMAELGERSVPHCRNAKLVWLDEATHWIQHEEPEKVNSQLIDFFG